MVTVHSDRMWAADFLLDLYSSVYLMCVTHKKKLSKQFWSPNSFYLHEPYCKGKCKNNFGFTHACMHMY